MSSDTIASASARVKFFDPQNGLEVVVDPVSGRRQRAIVARNDCVLQQGDRRSELRRPATKIGSLL